MKSKIEIGKLGKLGRVSRGNHTWWIIDELNLIIEKQNEIIDHLNSQDQEEYEKRIRIKGELSENRRVEDSLTTKGLTKEEEKKYLELGVCKHCGGININIGGKGTTHYFYCEDCEQPTDLVGLVEDNIEECELHDKLLEIWCGLLPTPSKSSTDPEPIRIRIEGTEEYVKHLLEEKEREVITTFLNDTTSYNSFHKGKPRVMRNGLSGEGFEVVINKLKKEK